MLGADDVIATRMVVEDGRYTGEIAFYAYGANKADGHPRARRPARATTSPDAMPTATRSPTCRCSRRSATRTPSTPTGRCAGRPIARGWPVLDFVHPAPLRRRLNGLTDAAGSRPRATATAAAALALTAAVVWAAARARRPAA